MRFHTRGLAAAFALCSLSSLATADDTVDDTVRDTVAKRPRLAVATDPIGLFAGRYALSTTYAVSSHVALRADMQITDVSTTPSSSEHWRAAFGVPVFLDRALHGPYVEPGLALAERLVSYAAIGGLGSLGGTTGTEGLGGYGARLYTPIPQYEQSIEPQVYVGWQWTFASGLTRAAAVGVAKHFATDGTLASIAVPLSYLRVGFAL